jgi:ArsR family transcriptional regulator
MRSIHAHARLGFTEGQMSDLFTAAGFAPADPIALPGGS